VSRKGELVKIGLVQVDGKLPNLALMQICAYHEAQGHQVEWFKGMLFADEYDKVYASQIFQFSQLPPLPQNALIGGTGIDFKNTLPSEIASFAPSWMLYPEFDKHLGFSMKGCRFGCKFCCVPQKEGRPRSESAIDDILTNPNGGNRLILMDNDFFGIPNWKENLLRIIDLKLRVCFVQGLNIRILTDEQAELLVQCNFQSADFSHKYLTFAWDRYQDGQRIIDGIVRCERAGILPQQMQFFVLIGYDTTPEQDLERVTRLRDLGCMPYVMPYNKFDDYQKRFARWVNHRAIFKTVKWEDYKKNVKKKTEVTPSLFL
jgi:hypothetical protein